MSTLSSSRKWSKVLWRPRNTVQEASVQTTASLTRVLSALISNESFRFSKAETHLSNQTIGTREAAPLVSKTVISKSQVRNPRKIRNCLMFRKVIFCIRPVQPSVDLFFHLVLWTLRQKNWPRFNEIIEESQANLLTSSKTVPNSSANIIQTCQMIHPASN